ncbi:hypothetical protein EDD15DRAFT_2197915 [Pisolithus albus]|nr:hypothetical protein EDD15DRAFT_2197915 [Pisolithus albus]
MSEPWPKEYSVAYEIPMIFGQKRTIVWEPKAVAYFLTNDMWLYVIIPGFKAIMAGGLWILATNSGVEFFFSRTIAVWQKPAKFSPQSPDRILGKDGRDSLPSHLVSGAYGSSHFPGENGGFDFVQVSSVIKNNLDLAAVPHPPSTVPQVFSNQVTLHYLLPPTSSHGICDHLSPLPTLQLSAVVADVIPDKKKCYVWPHCHERPCDQHGSRFMQQQSDAGTSEGKQILFDEVVPHNGLQLIQDIFGNFAVRFILLEQQGAFVKELDPRVLEHIKDASGIK